MSLHLEIAQGDVEDRGRIKDKTEGWESAPSDDFANNNHSSNFDNPQTKAHPRSHMTAEVARYIFRGYARLMASNSLRREQALSTQSPKAVVVVVGSLGDVEPGFSGTALGDGSFQR